MNYLKVDNPKILEDITKRKEFYQFHKSSDPPPFKGDDWVQKYDLNDLKEEDVNLEPQSYQTFVANFLNPNTPYSRALLKWEPGMGKTIAACNIAMQFIKLFERESQMEDQQIGSVFVIGFTEEIFKKELLSFPKFGFITRDELKQLNVLKEQAQHENKTDVDRLQEFMTRLKKRLGSRKDNGYFRFFGYKAFVNRIFMLQDFKRNLNDMNEEEIRKSLKDGSLKWNQPLLDSFKNSLIICDEIHNVYNSLEKNNWGVALQMVLDHDPSIKALFMSATPGNNNPTEYIDLANLMQPPNAKLVKEDLFDGKTLKKGALDRLGEVFRGRVSFIQDSDPRHFATMEILGDTIDGISYLKFIRCPMSKFHFQTYEKVYTGVLAQDAQYLMDIAFPNPVDPETGLYRTTEIKRALSFASDAWFKKFGFKIQNDIIVGPGLYEQNIGEWSTKYAELLKDIKHDLTPKGGKILIYHDVVHVSGVLFIEQLLQHNGFISIDQNDTAQTLCAICGAPKKDHSEHVEGGTLGGWQAIAPDTKLESKLRKLYRDVVKTDFDGEISPCNTKAIVLGTEPVAFIVCNDEDDNVTRVDALVVSPEYQNQGFDEYLLEHFTPADKVVTTVVPNTDQGLIEWYLDHYFQEHDRTQEHTFLSFEGRPRTCYLAPLYGGAVEKAKPATVQLSRNYKICMLNLTWASVFADVAHRNNHEYQSTDEIVLLIRKSTPEESCERTEGDALAGYIILEHVSPDSETQFYNMVHQWMDTDNLDLLSAAVTKMLHVMDPKCEILAHLGVRLDERPESPIVIRESPDVTGGASKLIKDHGFMPARYIVAHSDMDKSQMHKNIDRFNALDNTWGYNCRVIIGSKIIKESYNFKAIRKVKVTARPANAATLIQILGRSRRKKAHLMLPPEYRTIEVKIFTSCLPTKDARGKYKLSHEEQKYKEKIDDYKVIQIIEQKIHENAVDGVTARNIVLPGLDRKNPGLGALWFEPAQPMKRYSLKDLNLDTFAIFHSEDEIRLLIYIIKRLFIETSLCYTFEQLWHDVCNPPFHVEQDTQLFQQEYFVIALSMLVFGTQNGQVRPITNQDGDQNKTYLLDVLHSDIDKRIMQPDGTMGYIHHISNLYMFIPFRNGNHDIHVESPFRTFDLKINKPINISRYLKESTATLNYENQKLKFKAKYENVPLEKLATVVGKFGVSFHQSFVEELIKYVFTLWTNPAISVKSEMHEFYFKMLYYYDLMGLIVWAATAKEFMREQYKSYMLPVSVSSRSTTDTKGEIHSLEMSIGRSSHPGESIRASKTEYTEALKQSLLVLTDRAKTLKAKKKPTADIVKADPKVLPIGHFMSQVPRFFHPDKDWFESPEYVQRTQEFVENDIIVGYYEKSGTGLRVKFKIRTPIHKIQKYKDIRMIEKGSICSSNSKEYLVDIAKRLKIKIPDKINVPNLCHEIESQLQLNELEERKKKSNIKWFYSFWEERIGERRLTATSMSSSSHR